MLIIDTVIEIRQGSPAVVSILSAGAVKKCFDLGIPCYLRTVEDGEDAGSSKSGYVHLDKIEYADGEYEFTFGRTSLGAATLDDPIGSLGGPVG